MPGVAEAPVLYETAAGVATLTLNRPERLNTIVPALIEAFDEALARARVGIAHDRDVDLPDRARALQAPAPHGRPGGRAHCRLLGPGVGGRARARAGGRRDRAREAGRAPAREPAAHDEAAREPGV